MSNTNHLIEILPLKLSDLVPKNSTFYLAEIVDEAKAPKPLTLRRWSLLVKNYIIEKYGAQTVRQAFLKGDLVVIADVAFYMLDEDSKKNFKSVDHFMDSIVGHKDEVAVLKAVNETMGMGEVEMKKITEALEADPSLAEKFEKAVDSDPNLRAP